MEQPKLATILCCQCGAQMQSNSANMCFTCLSATVDITANVEKQNTIVFCTKCERYLNPPSQWVYAAVESPELLSLCLKRVRGLNKSLMVQDAHFLWTEPHSKRLNIEITVRGELQTGGMVQQKAVLQFTVHSQQCTDCTRVAAKDYWNACVQVRQKTEHKKTLLYLEQILLQTGAHKNCNNVRQVSGGMDFYFSNRAFAVTFVEFLLKKVPCRYQTSQQLKSHDIHNNTYNYKHTFSVEVAPICKDDIVCLPKALAQRLGSISQLVLVYKITDKIHIIDPVTCQVRDVDGHVYFANPFTAIASSRQLTEFIVIELEQDSSEFGGGGSTKLVKRAGQKHKVGGLAGGSVGGGAYTTHQSRRHTPLSAWVMRAGQLTESGGAGWPGCGAEDFGVEGGSEGMVHTRSHLGRLLHEGDTVLGLDLRHCNVNHTEFETIKKDRVPDVILVRKVMGAGGTAGPSWRLRRLRSGIARQRVPKRRARNDYMSVTTDATGDLDGDVEWTEEEEGDDERGDDDTDSLATGGGGGADEAEALAEFMRDMEEDEELARQFSVLPKAGAESHAVNLHVLLNKMKLDVPMESEDA